MKMLLAAWLGLHLPQCCVYCQVTSEIILLVNIFHVLNNQLRQISLAFLNCKLKDISNLRCFIAKLKSCLPLNKSGFKMWRKWKLQYDSNSTQAMINVLGWILSCAEFGLGEAEQSQGEQWHRATFPVLWSWARQGRTGCLRALKQPKRCFTPCSHRAAANPELPSPSSVLSWALLSSAPQPCLWP